MITRAHMRRQLRATGGITNARQGYGAGSWIKERIRKIIPNELADIAVKAAPFVAPFQPGIAAAMRGIGRFDQRGSISDALKQGALTYGFGKGARYLGGATGPAGGPGSYNLSNSPISRMWGNVTGGADTQATTAARTVGTSGAPGGGHPDMFYKAPSKQGFFAGAKEKWDKMGKLGKLGTVFAGSTIATMAVQAAMGDVGERKPGESLDAFNTRRRSTVGSYLDEYFRRANKFRIAPENMDKAAADFVAQNTKEYVASGQFNQGGRVGYAIGSPEKQMEAGAPPIIYEGNMDPRAQNQQAGLPSIPGPMQMAEDGPEFDMREKGGFQPLGRQEGKDDVPAMLAKNEFVMTADAVRAAGGGSIEQGAQKMYDTMKKLESRVA